MPNMMKTLGQNLTRIRVEKGLTRNDLATLLGISESELTEIEEGTTDVETGFIYKAASALGAGIEEIICSETTRNQLLEQIKCSSLDLI